MAVTLDVIRALIRLAVRAEAAEAGVRDLVGTPARTWEEALAVLEENRLIGRVGQALIEADLAPIVPPSLERHLRAVVAEKQARNHRRMSLWAELARELRARSIQPVLLKSTALVALLHPDQAAHEMDDVDVLVTPEQLPAVEALLVARGFRRVDASSTTDWVDPSDALRLDLHSRFEMFGRIDLDALVIERPATYPAGLSTVRVFHPDANLAHLVFHMNAHRPSLGYRLRWICDIAVCLRTWGHELSWARIRALLPDPRHRTWVLRVVRFCEGELGLALRGGLPAIAAGIDPFTLEEVLRSQRIAPWRLRRSPRGWVRLSASLLGVRRAPHLLPQLPGDALGWARDVIREQRALHRAAQLALATS